MGVALPGSRRMGLSRWDGGSGRNFGQPAARAIEPVQDVEPGGKKGVAASKRSHRCFLGMVRSDPHGGQNSPLWLKISCQARPGPPTTILPFLGLGAQSNAELTVVLKFDSGTFQRRLRSPTSVNPLSFARESLSSKRKLGRRNLIHLAL